VDRNCGNRKGLPVIAVDAYTEDLKHQLKDAPKVFSLGDGRGHYLRLYECPLTWITEETTMIIQAVYLASESGVLLFHGGWADQPAWFAEAFDVYKSERNKWQTRDRTSR
jgi:hypothetical protein